MQMLQYNDGGKASAEFIYGRIGTMSSGLQSPTSLVARVGSQRISLADHHLPWKKEESDFFPPESDRRVMRRIHPNLHILTPLLELMANRLGWALTGFPPMIQEKCCEHPRRLAGGDKEI